MTSTLESKALNGGMILVGRQLFGIVFSLIGMLVTTRLLGPHKYGQFIIVAGLTSYVINVGKLGLDVYLIRHQGELDQRQIGVTQCLYLTIGSLLAVAILAMGPVVSWWYDDPFLCQLFWAYAIITPLTLMGSIPIALLDRQLSYKRAAMTELLGQLTYVAFSLSIVLMTHSVWGVVVGIFAQTLLTLLLGTYWSNMRFRPCWNPLEARTQVHYGFGYSSSIWIWQIRDLVNPLLVGKLLGAEAAAFIAMALRLAGLVGFAKTAVWRVYLSYLARLAGERDKMREAIEAGLSHQVLITGVSFVAFLAIAPDLIQGLMGQKWMPVLQVFSFIAAGALFNSGFSLYSSALYIIGKNHDVSLFHVVHIILFVTSAWCFLVNLGTISGYGWAEVMAFFSYVLIRYAFRKRLFHIKETLMYVNISLFLGCFVLMTQLLAEPLWLRMGTAGLLLLVILYAVPQNRLNCLVVLNLAKQKLAAA
jgi:O-antigen/teichoic acid export membrane protein